MSVSAVDEEALGSEGSQEEEVDSKERRSVSSMLTQLKEEAQEEGEEMSFRHILETFGSNSFGPMLLLPSLLAMFPLTGGIPGMSIITAALILLVAGQILLMWEHPWVPKVLLERKFPAEKIAKSCDRMIPYAQKLGRYLKPRLVFLAESPFLLVVAAVCILLAAAMIPLALVPLGVLPLSFVLVLLSLGISLGDGVLILIGLVLSLGCMGGALYWLWFLI